MSANISAATKAQLIAACDVVYNRLESALATNGYTDDADDYGAALAPATPSISGKAEALGGLDSHRAALATILEDGRRMLTPILLQAGIEAGSAEVQGQTARNLAQLMRDINADLLGGTPDYVDAREVTFGADPAPGAVGVISRLLVDHNDEPLEGGFHNQDKTIRVQSKQNGRVVLRISGEGQAVGDSLDYRNGRPRVADLPVVSDVTGPTSGSVINPWLQVTGLVNEDPITDIPNWQRAVTGSPVVQYRTDQVWRGRPSSLFFRGPNDSDVRYSQPLRPLLTQNAWQPWQVGVPVRLTAGAEVEIELEMGQKTELFTEADLSAGNWVVLKFTLDKDNWPVNFDGGELGIRLKNTTNNSANGIHIAGILPQRMVQHEGIWYSAYAHTSDPTINQSVAIADACDFSGAIQDVIAFLYQDQAPGWAHLPSSGTTTIPAP